jgi:hypothetical protein
MMQLHIGITISMCIILYILMSKLQFGVKLTDREIEKDNIYNENKYISRNPYGGNPITMTIPFFRRIYYLFWKNDVNKSGSYKLFWEHIDRIISFWTSIRDDHKRENPEIIISDEERRLLHECWTHQSEHERLLKYLKMKEDTYEWVELPGLIDNMRYYDIHGSINWNMIESYLQSFIQQIGRQLMYGERNEDGTSKITPDCYQPPRFYGKYYENFERLEGMRNM